MTNTARGRSVMLAQVCPSFCPGASFFFPTVGPPLPSWWPVPAPVPAPAIPPPRSHHSFQVSSVAVGFEWRYTTRGFPGKPPHKPFIFLYSNLQATRHPRSFVTPVASWMGLCWGALGALAEPEMGVFLGRVSFWCVSLVRAKTEK